MAGGCLRLQPKGPPRPCPRQRSHAIRDAPLEQIALGVRTQNEIPPESREEFHAAQDSLERDHLLAQQASPQKISRLDRGCHTASCAVLRAPPLPSTRWEARARQCW